MRILVLKFIIISLFFTSGCGFKVINQSELAKFDISEINTTGNKVINFKLKNKLFFLYDLWDSSNLIHDLGHIGLGVSVGFTAKRNVHLPFFIEANHSVKSRSVHKQKIKRILFLVESCSNIVIMLLSSFQQQCSLSL